jgi:protein SCO1/2
MRKILSYLLFGFVILLIGGAIAFKVFQPITVLPRIRLAPGYALFNQFGQRLTNEDLRGKLVLYNFTYTRCPEPCFDQNATIKEVQSRLAEANLGDIEVAYVTVSFDPDHDSPEILKAYADTLGADPENWFFATTSNKALLKTIIGTGFEAYYEPKDDGTFTFDPVFVLVDGWGIIRGEYRYQTEVSFADRILRNLNTLGEEIRNSVGSAKLAYEAAHLFLCYSY